MAILWRLLLAHFVADFPLQSKWMIVNKSKPKTIAIHSALHFIATLIATYDLILNDPKIAGIAAFISIIHFITDYAKSRSTMRVGNSILLFFLDQLVHISVIITVTSFFFLEQYPMENLLYFRLTLAVFAIWTLPIIIMMCPKRPCSENITGEDLYLDENYKRSKIIERGLLFVAIATGLHLYPMIIAAIIIRWMLNMRDENFPVLTWSLVSMLAIAAHIWRVEWFMFV